TSMCAAARPSIWAAWAARSAASVGARSARTCNTSSARSAAPCSGCASVFSAFAAARSNARSDASRSRCRASNHRTMSLTPEDVRWVAHLARLELTDAELETMTRQLSAIVDYVAKFEGVNTDEVDPLAPALRVETVFRADEPRPSLPFAEALANAPDRRGDFYGVPAVLD